MIPMKTDIQILPMQFEGIISVCHNLRERSKEELYLMSPHQRPVDIAERFFDWPGAKNYMTILDGEPVACHGAYPMHSGVWGLYGFGTDKMERVLGKITRHWRREMLPALYNTGCHRAQCTTLEAHEETQRWLVMLGGVKEGVMRSFGRMQEDVAIYGWLRSDEHVRRRTEGR